MKTEIVTELTPEQRASSEAIKPLVAVMREQIGNLCIKWVGEGVPPSVILERLTNLGGMILSDVVAYTGLAVGGEKPAPEAATQVMMVVGSMAGGFYAQMLNEDRGPVLQ